MTLSTDHVGRPTPLRATCLEDLDGIRHGFFSRAGGVSDGIYAGLNCGFGSNDDPERVAENRRRVAATLGVSDGTVSTPYQVHGVKALTINAPVDRDRMPKGDALVTATPGVIVAVLTADCCPVLLADPGARIVGAAHAGWRGAVAGIVEAAVAEMERQGARRSAIRGAAGPCIAQAAYEVGEDFRAEVVAADPESEAFLTSPTEAQKSHFDLSGYVLHRMSKAGIVTVCAANACTYADESKFFSYRRTMKRQEPDYGRQISAIVVA